MGYAIAQCDRYRHSGYDAHIHRCTSVPVTPRVLIVDDANFTRDLIRKAVRSRFPHFHLEEAGNGKQAQKKLATDTFHLVLCDWEMPEMGGDELLRWVRGNEGTKTLPFIMITSRGDKENVVQAIQLGVSNYVTKPFTTDKLVDVIVKVLAKHLPASALRPPTGTRPASMGNDSANVLLARQTKRSVAPGPFLSPSTSHAIAPPAPHPISRVRSTLPQN